MKKKLDTRFPATRIKRIMQNNENIGKMNAAVPLVVSKALENFLQQLCTGAYEITLGCRLKTLSSQHLKQCVEKFDEFKFLEKTVSKVPKYDVSSSDTFDDDYYVDKKRKIDGPREESESSDESKWSMVLQTSDTMSTGRQRGGGRGRPPRRHIAIDKYKDDPDIFVNSCGKYTDDTERLDDGAGTIGAEETTHVRNFDLNVPLDENGEHMKPFAPPQASSSSHGCAETNHQEYPGWSPSDIESLAVGTMNLTNLSGGIIRRSIERRRP